MVEELDKSGNYPAFKCFSTFLNKEVRIACNPIVSPFLLNFKREDRTPKRAKAFTTSAQTNSFPQVRQEVSDYRRPPCPVCQEETHGIATCFIFAAKAMDEKKRFIKETHLCFGCLRKGHASKDCKRRHTCGTCNRRHPTCLHEEWRQRPTEISTNDSISASNHTTEEVHRAMSYASTRYASATASIVPVLVSTKQEPQKEVLTYALLDTQSDTTFILEDLLGHLSVTSRPVTLKLSTMTAVDTVFTSKGIRDLQVRGLHYENLLQINQAYTRSFIPVDKSYIPTRETAQRWPHLQHLTDRLPPLQDCDVGLLIGYNCPSALAPLEVVIGKENEPFAQRTELGWSIIGSTNPHLDRQGSQSFVHRVTVKEIPAPTVTDVLKVLEADFNERIYEDKYVSQNDVQFIQFLSNNIRQKDDGHLEMPLPFQSSSPPVLPNNRKLVVVRLENLKRKLKADKRYHD